MTAAPDAVFLDLYKLAVESADRVTARRGTANSFYLTVQTAFIAVLAVAVPQTADASLWQTGIAAAAGLTLSTCWWLQLRSYRQLNAAKFTVINQMEDQLPVPIFRREWESLKNDPAKGWRGRYAELGTVERVVPWVFAVLYLNIFLAEVLA